MKNLILSPSGLLKRGCVIAVMIAGSITLQAQIEVVSGGNVGVGTSSPAQKLDVNGTVKAIDFLGTIGATVPSAGAFTTVIASGGITPSQTIGIVGTTTSNNANAGSVGEYLESIVGSSAAISLSSGTVINITSLSLTAGDWDVYGVVYFIQGSSTLVTRYKAGIGTVSADIPATSLAQSVDLMGSGAIATGTNITTLTIPTARFSLPSTTTVYLISMSTFSVSTQTTYGAIRARRAR